MVFDGGFCDVALVPFVGRFVDEDVEDAVDEGLLDCLPFLDEEIGVFNEGLWILGFD